MDIRNNKIVAPVAKKIPVENIRHAKKWIDNYGWVRVENWQEVLNDPSLLAPEVRKHLEVENAYTKKVLAPTEQLQDKLYNEFVGRIKQDDSSVPKPDGDYEYGRYYNKGEDYPVYYRVQRGGDHKEVLLDINKLAKGKEYFSASLTHSPDQKLLAVSIDDKGSEFYQIKIFDIATKKFTNDLIEKTDNGVAWASDSKTLFYVERDDNHRPVAVHRHKIGETQSQDIEVYREKDPAFFISVWRTTSGRFVIIEVGDHSTTEAYVIPGDKPETTPRVIEPRTTNLRYYPRDGGDKFIILTNADDAVDSKIVTAPIDAPGKKNWQDLIGHKAGRLIVGFDVFKDYIALLEQQDAVRRMNIYDRRSGDQHPIIFDDAAYTIGIDSGFEYDTNLVRFEYSSPRQPEQVFDYNMADHTRRLRKEQEIPSGYDSNDYVVKLLMAPATDGNTIPITVLYKKGTALDGSAPCLLYGYGSYGYTVTARFRITPLSLVNRGFIYAVAHIRGGRAKGENWYLQTKKGGKVKTFYDFLDAANYLIDKDFTSEGKIVAQGGSAGGMLMGAIVNINPRLFAGIIALVPFVDVLNTMLDDTLPLTPPEWPEWGNPIKSAEEFAIIRSYSPYDNVSDQSYPPILATGGLTDPRVTYWEPTKWVAKLREHQKGKAPILLYMNMGAGHAGLTGRFAELKETALEQAFAIFAVGKL